MKAILTYHSIDDSGSVISVDSTILRKHASWLASGRVRVVPLSALGRQPAGSDAVAITFDDGFQNFASTAWPILREHGLDATVFVVTGRVGSTNRWTDSTDPTVPDLPLMGWDTIGKLADEGVEIGSHGRTHRPLGGLPAEALASELEGSAAAIRERAGVDPTSLAYPYGAHDAAAELAARRYYERACTTRLAALEAEDDPHLLPRLDSYYYRAEGRLEAWGTSVFRTHLWLRGSARRVRRAVTGAR